MKTNCVTHHYACDCREEIFKETQGKLKLALEVIEKLKKSNDFYANFVNYSNLAEYGVIYRAVIFSDMEEINEFTKHGGKLARQTQKEVNEMMVKLNKEG